MRDPFPFIEREIPMETTPNPKPKLHQKLAAGWKKHERKILIATTVTSTAAAVVFRSGIAQHNAFLKEHGLYEQFYELADETVA
jgi:hypothetical protein